jgi:hypothetical protein
VGLVRLGITLGLFGAMLTLTNEGLYKAHVNNYLF